MPINAHPEYLQAEIVFNSAETEKEKLEALEEMIKWVPKHKGGENLRAQLKTKYKKFKEKIINTQKKNKSRKKSQPSIKKSDMQAIIIGLTNTGKSSILKSLTNAQPQIASYGFTTTRPEQGMMNYGSCQIQIIDLPPIGNENFDKGLTNTAETILIVIEKIHELTEIQEVLKKSKGKQIIIFNKIDLYDEQTKRKIKDTLKTKKYNFVLTSTKTGEGIEELKEKIFESFSIIRIYTKQPSKKEPESKAMIMSPNSTVEDAAKKILGNFIKDIKKTKIWGPSSKFSGQVVGLKHILKDKDVIEFQTK